MKKPVHCFVGEFTARTRSLARSLVLTHSLTHSLTHMSPDATKTRVMMDERMRATSSCHFFTDPAPAQIGPNVRSNDAALRLVSQLVDWLIG